MWREPAVRVELEREECSLALAMEGMRGVTRKDKNAAARVVDPWRSYISSKFTASRAFHSRFSGRVEALLRRALRRRRTLSDDTDPPKMSFGEAATVLSRRPWRSAWPSRHVAMQLEAFGSVWQSLAASRHHMAAARALGSC